MADEKKVKVTKLDPGKDWYTIEYPSHEILGEFVHADFANPGDVSTYSGRNDGSFLVSVGKGEKVKDKVTIEGNEGGIIQAEVEIGS